MITDNKLLTDEQIESKALEIYPVINDNTDPAYRKQDILFEHREIYKDTWKECTEHYKELIEAGMKCGQPVDKVDAVFYIIKGIQIMNELTDDEMIEIIGTVLDRRKKAKQINRKQYDISRSRKRCS